MGSSARVLLSRRSASPSSLVLPPRLVRRSRGSPSPSKSRRDKKIRIQREQRARSSSPPFTISRSPTMSTQDDLVAPSARLYAILYPLTHPTFRIPVLESVAATHNIPLTFYPLPPDSDSEDPSSSSSWSYADILSSRSSQPDYHPHADLSRPFSIVSLPSDEAAQTLLRHCTAIRSIVHLWSCGSTRSGVLTALKHPSSHSIHSLLQPESLSWKADVLSLGIKLSFEEKRSIIESCRFLDFAGPIRMKEPDFEWCWYEEAWRIEGAAISDGIGSSKAHTLRLVVVGRKISPHTSSSSSTAPAAARDWIDRLDLKKRSYIGNTSMESEMSLAMAQMAQSAPGKIIYDPFVGTGSLVVAAAALGAYVMGSDIDGRMIRGKSKELQENPGSRETGVLRAARQYGLEGRFLDCLTFDITQHPWRLLHPNASSATASARPGFLDAIIADPPYGVRAGAKRLGHRDVARQRDEPYWLEEKGGYSHEQEDYVPPTRPYALNDLLDDLLAFAARMLKVGGRLVFWMPVMNDEEVEQEAQEQQQQQNGDAGKDHLSSRSKATPVPSGPEWELIAVSTQDFGKWARRLVTLQLRPAEGSNGAELRRSEGQSQLDAKLGRYKGNYDPQDFRNRFFGPKG